MSKPYLFHSDPGHGWLAVQKSFIIQLGIVDKISQFSYVNGGTVYLEEDMDAQLFIKTYKETFLMEPTIKELKNRHNRHTIRSYARYNKENI